MDSVKADNERELTSTMGNVLSMSSKDEKNDTSDATPTSSTDANTIPTASRIVSDDPISSTSSDIIEQNKSKASEANMQNSVEVDETTVDEPDKSSSVDPEADLLEMSISNVSNEKITEDVEDLVHDLESLLGESTDSFNIPIKRKEGRKSPSEYEDRKSLDDKEDTNSPGESEARKLPDEKGDAVDQREINNQPQTSSEEIVEIISSDETISEEADQDTETKMVEIIPDENTLSTQAEVPEVVQESKHRQSIETNIDETNRESNKQPKEVNDEDSKESNKPVNDPCPLSDKDQENSSNSEASEAPHVDVGCKLQKLESKEEKSDALHKENEESSEVVVENIGDSAVNEDIECIGVPTDKAIVEEENKEHPNKQIDKDDVSVEEIVEKSEAANIEAVEKSAEVEDKSKDFETKENPQDITENEVTSVIEENPTGGDKTQATAEDTTNVSEKEDTLDVKTEPTTTNEIQSCDKELNSGKESLKVDEQFKEEEAKEAIEEPPKEESTAEIIELREIQTEDVEKEKDGYVGITEDISKSSSLVSESKTMEQLVTQNELVEVNADISDAEQCKEGCGQVDGTVTENEENKLQTETALNKEAVEHEADGDAKLEEIPPQSEVQEIAESITEDVDKEINKVVKESAEEEESDGAAIVTEPKSQVNIPESTVEIIAEAAEPKIENIISPTSPPELSEEVIEDAQCSTSLSTDKTVNIQPIDEIGTSNPTEMVSEPSEETETSKSPIAENITPEVSTNVDTSVSIENKENIDLASKSKQVEDDNTEADQTEVENAQSLSESTMDISEEIEQVGNPKSPITVLTESTEEKIIVKSEETKAKSLESLGECAEDSTEISQSESKEILEPVSQTEVLKDIPVVEQSETAEVENVSETEGQSLEENITDETHKGSSMETEAIEVTTHVLAEEIAPDTAENNMQTEGIAEVVENKTTVSNDEHPELTDEPLIPSEEADEANDEISSTNEEASLHVPVKEPFGTGNDNPNSAEESSLGAEKICELNEETTKPAEETSKPDEETPVSVEDTSKPDQEISVPAEETSKPVEETSKPAEEISEPAEKTSKPDEETSVLVEDTSKPDEEISEPAEETSVLVEDISKPDEKTLVPAAETSKPDEETSKPDEETLVPAEEISKPDEETSKSDGETSEPAEETSKPDEETSVSAEETLKPDEEVSKPVEDISEPVEESHNEITKDKLPETESNIESMQDQITEDASNPEGDEKIEVPEDLMEENDREKSNSEEMIVESNLEDKEDSNKVIDISESNSEEMIVEPNQEDKEDSSKVIEISDDDSKTTGREPESFQISSSSADSDSEEVVPVLALEPDEDIPSPKELIAGRDDTEVDDSSVEVHPSDTAAVTEPLPEIEDVLTDQGRVDEAAIDMQENLETILAVASLQNIENTQATVQTSVEPEMSEKERREMEALRKAVESITENTTNDFEDDDDVVELITDVAVPEEGTAMEPETIDATESLLQVVAPELVEDKIDTVVEIDDSESVSKVVDSGVDNSDEDVVELKIEESAESVQVLEEDSAEENTVESKPDNEAEESPPLPDTSEDKVIDNETKQPETKHDLPDSSQSVTLNEEARQSEASRDKDTKTKANERPKRHKKSSTDNKLEELSINVDVPDKEKPYSPKVTIKPIKVPDEEVSTTSNSDSEIGKGSLKMTITKQSDKMHSILKICDPESSEAGQEQEEPIPKLIIKPKIQQVEQQHSPKMSTRSSRQVYSPTSSTQRSGSPRITIKPVVKPEKVESVSPLKIKIKPEDTPKKHNPKVNIKPIAKPDEDVSKESLQSPRKVIIKPVVKPVEELEQVHSPRITIKPIPKPEAEKESAPVTPRLNIKPIKKQEDDDSEVERERSSPKITIKPVVKPQEPDTQSTEGDEEVKERIVLKINKGNLPTPTKDPKKREHPPDDEKSEKLAKITVKFSKGGGHAHIVQQSEESNKRALEEQSTPEKVKKQKIELESPISTRSKHKEAVTESPVETRSKHKEVAADNPTGDSAKTKQKETEPAHESPRTKHKDPMPESPIEVKRAKLKDTAPETTVHESTRSNRNKETASEVQVCEASKSRPNALEKSEANNENTDDVKIVETKLDSPIVISEDSRSQDSGSCVIVDELKDPLSAIPVFEITAESAKAMMTKSESVSSTPCTPPTPTPRKRGRPRKVPIVVREDFKEQDETPKPEAPKGDAPPTAPESGRPKRSCRGQSARATLGIKPRKPRGPGRGRGSKRGMGTRSVPMKPEGLSK